MCVPEGCSLHWNHIDQNDWPEICLKGKRQSPINLDSNIARDQSFAKFHFSNFDKGYRATAINNGHSVVLTLDATASRPKVSGGGLSKEYTTDHLHFHWQAEHTVNRHRYPLEAHIVNFASEYKNMSNAVKFEDGIAVLGVLYDMSPDDDIELQALTDILDEVENNQISFHVNKEIQLRSFLPRDVAGFFRYDGSLTTPGCDESVTWTVFTNTLPISHNQIKRFEAIKSESGKVTENFRALQKLGNRTLYIKKSPLPHNGCGYAHVNVLILLSIIWLPFTIV
ncbi:putative carbonic anhydrase 3 isoform X2 [Photinus pyralis]|uniref:putative carbonic anhydrase 3 isoform X2 n=1 Tax=Photinus pyralis TaxID=7054 RepID=UPI0012678312|nr:putative carbonic anhydrase 3 isoform X2 [Photinus pyralis]